MTSQIILLNGFGVAIASDSAATVGARTRTYQTAEKIVPLPAPHRIAVTHSGNVRIGNLPYSVLVGEWARQLGDKPLRSVRAYQDHFIDWLESNVLWFSSDTEENQTMNFIDGRVRQLAEVYANAKQENPEYQLNTLVEAWTVEVNEYPRLEGTSIREVMHQLHQYESQIAEKITQYLGDAIPPEDDLSSLYLYFATFYSSTWMTRSTLVFTGYAERDILPSWIQVNIFGFVNKKITWHIEDSYSLTPDHDPLWSICLPAQQDAINQYLLGYDSEQVDGITDNVLEFIDEMTVELGENYKLDQPEQEAFQEAMSARKTKLAEVIKGFNRQFSEDSYLIPFRRAISILPAASLVDVAKSIIELQVLRQTTTAQLDTVGGPIDVALISPTEGFQWIRHKTMT